MAKAPKSAPPAAAAKANVEKKEKKSKAAAAPVKVSYLSYPSAGRPLGISSDVVQESKKSKKVVKEPTPESSSSEEESSDEEDSDSDSDAVPTTDIPAPVVCLDRLVYRVYANLVEGCRGIRLRL